jgi:hypothetical protein
MAEEASRTLKVLLEMRDEQQRMREEQERTREEQQLTREELGLMREEQRLMRAEQRTTNKRLSRLEENLHKDRVEVAGVLVQVRDLLRAGLAERARVDAHERRSTSIE